MCKIDSSSVTEPVGTIPPFHVQIAPSIPTICYAQHHRSNHIAPIMTGSNNHAMVIGASGLIGWSVVNQLLRSYPTEGTFAKVTALVNRPLDLEKCYWPETTDKTPELDLIPGINLLATDEELKATLKERVADVASITHVYYFGTSVKARITNNYEVC